MVCYDRYIIKVVYPDENDVIPITTNHVIVRNIVSNYYSRGLLTTETRVAHPKY
jgi:hypothetical protein